MSETSAPDPQTADIEERLKRDILPLFRTHSGFLTWREANEYGTDAHGGVDELRDAAASGAAALVLSYVQKAIASTKRVIMRADDSSGIIGDVVQQLLELHAELATLAPPPPVKLVRWIVAFAFDEEVDYFQVDIARYVEALGPRGVARYRAELDRIEASVPDVSHDDVMATVRQFSTSSSEYERMSHARAVRSVVEQARRRLAVADRDVDAVIATHGGDGTRAYQLEDVAKALAEIGEMDRAIEFAERAAFVENGWQAERAARRWCDLLADARPDEELAARRVVFERWPNGSNASTLRRVAGPAWADIEGPVLAKLSADVDAYIGFILRELGDARRAWHDAHRLNLRSADTWTRLVDAYAPVDAAAVLPVLEDLVESDLEVTGVDAYRTAVRRLKLMHRLSVGVGVEAVAEAKAFTARIREENRRRPRFLAELDRARLPG
ncbi:hypothetical protein J7E29_09505 [Streptomyces sp. ISL-90]|nr:hypothetical protein [Streptomyces sp. ISL-90]